MEEMSKYSHIVWNQQGNYNITLRKKTEPKQCPLGTVLKNGALKALFWKMLPFWWGAFCHKGTVLVPFLLKRAPFFKTVPKGHCFGSVFFLSVIL